MYGGSLEPPVPRRLKPPYERAYGSLNANTLPLATPDITATYCLPSSS